ncbi:MAG: hypothetical protein D6718_01685 [Acidobacteria bacterium]|nr:MAG: hypothetical protein D6718_01685 [Acidobacteriota bacterium]
MKEQAMERASVFALAAVLLVSLALAGKGSAGLPEDPRDIPREAQLTVTRTTADLDRDGRPEGLILVNAMTGEQDPARASEVVVGITAPDEGDRRGALLWSRHVMSETGRPAHDGELTVVDLDGDGRQELILTWDRSLSPKRIDRWAEIYATEQLRQPRKIWEGAWERDTRRDPRTPAAEREWFRREIDYRATRKAAGRAVVFVKRIGMAAGKAVDPPKGVQERVDVALRRPPRG